MRSAHVFGKGSVVHYSAINSSSITETRGLQGLQELFRQDDRGDE